MSGAIPYSPHAFMVWCSVNDMGSFTLLFPVFLVRVRFEVDPSGPWLSCRHPWGHWCGLRCTHETLNGIFLYEKGSNIFQSMHYHS
jgi:hypothetical protein